MMQEARIEAPDTLNIIVTKSAGGEEKVPVVIREVSAEVKSAMCGRKIESSPVVWRNVLSRKVPLDMTNGYG